MEYDNNLLEKFAQMVKATGGIRQDSAIKFLGVDDKTIAKMAGVLGEHNIIKIDYTIVGETIYKPGPSINKRVDDDLKQTEDQRGAQEKPGLKPEPNPAEENISSEDKTERVDRIIEELRGRMLEKKLNNKKTG